MVVRSIIRTTCTLSLITALAFLAAFLPLPSKHAFAVQVEERPLLMIVVGFDKEGETDAVPYSNAYDWNEALFSGEESLAAYYRAQSQGLLSLVPAHETSAFDKKRNTNRSDRADDGIVHVKLDSAHRAWGLVSEDIMAKNDFTQAVVNALDAARTYVDFPSFDENGDGRIAPEELTVIICTSGYDATELNRTGRKDLPLLWPHSDTIDDSDINRLDGEGALPSAYLAIAENYMRENEDPSEAEQEPISIIAHELGHSLGLYDLYTPDSDTEEGAWAAYEVGDLSLMATGAWSQGLDNRYGWVFRPTSLDPWSLAELGWCTPLKAEEDGDYHLYSRNSNKGFNTLLIPTADSSQYFLLENRQIDGWDSMLGNASENDDLQGGVVIWHIDTDICERYGAGGKMNDANHSPGVMPVFFERDEAGTPSVNWAISTPDLEEPFFSATSIARNLGDANASISLPLYVRDDDADLPMRRTDSGILVQVLSKPGDDMVVHLKLAGDAKASESSTGHMPPVALIAFLVIICVIGASALALNEARRSSRRG